MAARHWRDSNGNWTEAANWTGGVVPGSADNAVISASGSYTVSEDASSTAVIAVNALTISAVGAALAITDVTGNAVGLGGVSNRGTLALDGTGALTVAGDFTNRGRLALDQSSGDGGAGLTIGGTLDNFAVVQIGSIFSNLSASTVVTLGGLDNRKGAAFQVLGSADHQATLQFSSGGPGFTSNAGTFTLSHTAPLTLNNAFANSGTFTLGGGAALTVAGDLTNSRLFDLDIGGGDGGGRLAIGGTLVNTGAVQIGPNDASLSAATVVTISGLDNRSRGMLQVFGAASHSATVTVAGPAANAGTIDIDSFAVLEVTGGNAFTQIGGTTTVSGRLTAATIDIEGGIFAVDTASFTNSGKMIAANGGRIDFSRGGLTNLSGTTLTGGIYEVDAKGILQLPNDATVATLAADLTLSGTGSVVRSRDTATKAEVAIETTLTTIAAGGALGVLAGRSYKTANKLTDAGALTIGGGSNFTAAALSIAAGGTLEVDAGARLSLGSPLALSGTATNAGKITGGGPVAVRMASGAGRLVLDPGGTFGGSVVGGGTGSVLELAAGSSSGILKVLGTNFTGIGTVTVDPGATWTVEALAPALSGVRIKGSGGANILTLRSAGAATLAGVSGFPTINLAAGNSTVTVTDTTLSGGRVTIRDGASGNNIVSAARSTAASRGKTLTYLPGGGTDKFTGGFENDVVKLGAAAVSRDTLVGGTGKNTLDLTSAGRVALTRTSGFGTIKLAAGNNTVTIGDSTLSGGSVAISPGGSGDNSLSAAGDTAASRGKTLTYVAGGGTDKFTGGFENDVVKIGAAALGRDSLEGGSGRNRLDLTSAGKVDLSGAGKFGTARLHSGNNTVTVADKTLGGGAVTITGGASGTNRLSAAGDTAASKGKTLRYITPSGSGSFTGGFENDVVDASGDSKSSRGKTFTFTAGSGISSFTGGFENDVVRVRAAAVSRDTLTGGSGRNQLKLASAGSFSLAGVGRFATIDLAAGNNTLTLGDKTLSGGPVTIVAGARGNNSISATGDTAASRGKTLTYLAGTGADKFTGGFENDVVKIGAAAASRSTLTGGRGKNTLDLTSAGTANLAKAGGFGTIKLAAGNNTVTLSDKTLALGAVTITPGASGNNTISAAGDTAASKGKTLSYRVGGGTDKFTGGFENDIVKASAAAVGRDTLGGGSGNNTLEVTSAGAVKLARVGDFGAINLATGNNRVTLADKTLGGGTVTLNAGARGSSNIDATDDTAASTGKRLRYIAGTGAGSFTGGFENDVVNLSGDTAASKGHTFTFTAGSGTARFAGGFENDVVKVGAAALARDTLTGGSGRNTLDLTSAGKVDLSRIARFGAISLAAGRNTVTVADKTLGLGAVTITAGATGSNKISATGDTAASRGKTLGYKSRFGAGSFVAGFEDDVIDLSRDGASSKGRTFTFTAGRGTASFTGGVENDRVTASAAAVSRDTLRGGSGNNRLDLTSAGTVELAGVGRFAAIKLAGGDNTVTLGDRTLGGGAVTITAGTSGNNRINATGDTAASTGKTLTYLAGSGTDRFTGGFENDFITISAAALGRDTLTGGSGVNTIELTSPGTLGISRVSGFGTYLLASGGPNNLTLQNGNFAGLGGSTLIMVFGGNSGNRLSGAALSAKNAAVLEGGSASDTLIAGRNEVLIGGAGADRFRLTTPGRAASPDTNTIADFTHNFDTVAFSEKGFGLGKNPDAASLFTANPTGNFTAPTQRFAYATTTGALFFGAQGSAGSSREIATLSAHPTLTATDITFVA